MTQFHSKDSEEELWKKYKENNDQYAFAKLVEPYKKPVLALLFRVINDQEEAFDLFQETLRRFAFNYDPAKSSPKTFIYKIALNVAKTQYSRNRKRTHISLDQLIENGADFEGTVNVSHEEKKMALLQDAILQLKPKDRDVIDLKDIEGLTYKESAEILGCTLKRFEKRLFKARQRLRKIIESRLKYMELIEDIIV